MHELKITEVPNATIVAAEAFLREHFPECVAAFLAGSVVRGEATTTSDLDIVIITGVPDAPFRESFVWEGWPIEAFVHNEQSLLSYFASDRELYAPKLQQMCLEGLVLRDHDGLAARTKAEARSQIEAGPSPLTPEETERMRYIVTDLLDDFSGVDHDADAYFIAHDLASASARLILRANRQWLGGGKWTLRALTAFDPYLAEHLAASMSQFYRSGDKKDLLDFAERALAPLGGRLFEGYRSPRKRDTSTPGNPE